MCIRDSLDLTSPDPTAVDELVALGATVIEAHELTWANHGWTVLADPEGNEFCVAPRAFTGVSGSS